MIIFVFIILHLSHVSSFYTIKTYMEAVDVPKIRANFKLDHKMNVSDQSIIIAEVLNIIIYTF